MQDKERLGEAYSFEKATFSGNANDLIDTFLSEQKRHIDQDQDAEAVNQAFDILLNGQYIKKEISSCNDDKSFCIVAKENASIIGVCLFLIDTDNTVVNSFSGVDYYHAKKGIATELIRRSHAVMKEMGISQYRSAVQPYSPKAIENVVGAENVHVLKNLGSKKICKIIIT